MDCLSKLTFQQRLKRFEADSVKLVAALSNSKAQGPTGRKLESAVA